MEPSSLGAYFVTKAIESKPGISLNQIEIIPTTIENHHQMFIEDKVDAIATFEPQKSLILKTKGHVIFDSTQIPNQIFDVLITKESFAKQNPLALTELVNGHFKAINLLKTKEKKTISEMAKFESITATEFKKSLSGIQIPDRSNNIKLLKSDSSKIQSSIVSMHNFLKNKLIINKNNNSLPQISSQFLSASNNK